MVFNKDKKPVPPTVSLLELYVTFMKIALLSAGGGLSAWVERIVVEDKKWCSQDEFLSMLSISQILPGPNVINSSVFLGTILRGPAGAFACLTGLLSIPFFLLLALWVGVSSMQGITLIQNLIAGMAAAAGGMLLSLGLTIAGKNYHNIPYIIVAAAVFILIGVMRLPMLQVLAVIIPLTLIHSYYTRKKPEDVHG